MASNAHERAKSSRRSAEIDLQSQTDLLNWAESLDVSEEELIRAVNAVGPSAEAVREYLREEE
jgi:hypothetical protein